MKLTSSSIIITRIEYDGGATDKPSLNIMLQTSLHRAAIPHIRIYKIIQHNSVKLDRYD